MHGQGNQSGSIESHLSHVVSAVVYMVWWGVVVCGVEEVLALLDEVVHYGRSVIGFAKQIRLHTNVKPTTVEVWR